MRLILKFILIELIFLFSSVLYAQQIITTGGDFHQNSTGSISYTIGETVIETYLQSNNILITGIQ